MTVLAFSQPFGGPHSFNKLSPFIIAIKQSEQKDGVSECVWQREINKRHKILRSTAAVIITIPICSKKSLCLFSMYALYSSLGL